MSTETSDLADTVVDSKKGDLHEDQYRDWLPVTLYLAVVAIVLFVGVYLIQLIPEMYRKLHYVVAAGYGGGVLVAGILTIVALKLIVKHFDREDETDQ